MGYERTHSFQKKDSRTPEPTTMFRSRPFAAPVQMKPKEQQTPEDLKNEAFKQNKLEAFGLQLKEESGTITPVEQERLGVLQAKMDDFWAQRQERASRSGFDISKVSFTPREGQAAPQLQPMWRQGRLGVPMEGQRSLFDSPQKLSASALQAKLTIGEPGDQYEQEADRIASQVVQQINAPASAQSTQGQSVQRQEEQEGEEVQAKPEITAIQRQEEKAEELQAKSTLKSGEEIAGGEASTDLDTAINSARGGGQPLDAGLQQSMGQAMGADFSGVRVHTDSHSDELNQSIQAKAFTTGQDVFFRQGAYEPGSRGGQELIAHELTHVVQQSSAQLHRHKVQRKIGIKNDDTGKQDSDTQWYTHSEVFKELVKNYGLPRTLLLKEELKLWDDHNATFSDMKELIKTLPNHVPTFTVAKQAQPIFQASQTSQQNFANAYIVIDQKGAPEYHTDMFGSKGVGKSRYVFPKATKEKIEKDIEASQNDSEVGLMESIHKILLDNQDVLSKIQRFRPSIYIRIVSTMGPCDGCKERIALLKQKFFTEARYMGLVIDIHYSSPPGKAENRENSTYGWVNDPKWKSGLGKKGLYAHTDA